MDLHALAKAELHCHIDNLVDPAMVRELAATGEPLAIDLDALVALYPIRSIEQWLAYVALVDRAALPADRWLPRFLELHVARLRAQNVRYAEIFVSSLLFAREDLGALVELWTELRARARAAAGPELAIGLVVCIGRGPADRLARQAPRIAALRRAGLVCGVSLAGIESKSPVRPLARFFDEFHELGLGIEIHAGELAGAESVRDALQFGRPDRLGHAIAAFDDDALIAEIIARDIHVEFCPSSNLALGVVHAVEDHPIRRARELGMSFSINTDDPGPFACSLTSELALVERTFGFGADDFATIYANTMRAAFRE